MRNLITHALATIALLTVSAAGAESSRQFGEYTVHYNTMTSDMLSAQVASAYNIRRSRNRGMLNVTILRGDDNGGVGSPVRARVNAATITLTGRYNSVSMQEISDGDAVYYIGTFPIRNEETLDFQVNIEPRGTDNSYQLTFRKQFFVTE